jgi:serine/threonine protein kinase
VIGKGSFGKVRFAINLFYVNKFPGDIICVKKTSNIK